MYFTNEPDRCIANKYSVRWGKSKESSAVLGLLKWGGQEVYIIAFDYEVHTTSGEQNNAQGIANEIKENTEGKIQVLYKTANGESGDCIIPIAKAEGKTKMLGDEGLLQLVLGFLNSPIGTVADGAETILNALLLPLGDGVLTLVNTSVGEIITIDRLVFNKVSKVSIDYFNRETDAKNAGGQRPVKAMMKTVVNSWYTFFRNIAVIVYMIMLVVVGIRVILSSTADKKAQYQDMLVNWVVGVAMLFFFPYVMKYTIELNAAVVSELNSYLNPTTATETYPAVKSYNMFDKNVWSTSAIAKTWGEDRFVELMLGKSIIIPNTNLVNTDTIKSDGMMYVRVYAQKLNKLFLTAVYFIQIGQTIVLLFMYYKRAFMLAFLITIFPLVSMTYVLDKVGDKKAQSFGIWFKEFLVNVIVQLFHATVYVIVTSTGVQTFIDTGGSNWVFMIISVLFLFEGEKILRNIFGVKSAAGTMGDLAATGAMILGTAKSLGKGFGGGSGIGSARDAEDAKGVTERNKQRSEATSDLALPSKSSAADALALPSKSSATDALALPPKGSSGSSGSGSNGGSGSSGAAGRFDMRGAMDSAYTLAGKRKMTRGVLSKTANIAGRTIGGIAGATYGMSKGDSNGSGILGNALVSGAAGSAVGESVVSPIDAGLNKIEQKHSASKTSQAIASGAMDSALGLDKMMPADIDPNEVVGKNGETMQEIYRKALAEMARVSGTKGMAKGEEKFFKVISDLTDESKLK